MSAALAGHHGPVTLRLLIRVVSLIPQPNSAAAAAATANRSPNQLVPEPQAVAGSVPFVPGVAGLGAAGRAGHCFEGASVVGSVRSILQVGFLVLFLATVCVCVFFFLGGGARRLFLNLASSFSFYAKATPPPDVTRQTDKFSKRNRFDI